MIDPVDTFYHDLPKERAEHYASSLQRHSLNASRSPAGPAGYADSAYNGRRAYIVTEDDHALPTFLQTMMVEKSGVEWEIKRMNSSHSPFLSHTDEVADYIVDLSKRYAH